MHRPHRHGDGLAAAGRLARQSADRRRPRSTPGSTPSPSWSPTRRWPTTLREQLRGVYDLERLLARVTTGRASPRDLSFVGRTLRAACRRSRPRSRPATARCLTQLEGATRSVPRPARAGSTRRWPTIARWPAATAASSATASTPSSTPCASWPAAASSGSPATRPRRSQRTGIPSLKVGFNKVFGYYLEITNTHRAKIPAALHPQADGQERRALHHAGAEGVRGEGADGRREVAGAGVRAVSSSCATRWPPQRRRLQAHGRRAGRSSTCWRRWPSWPGIAATAGRRSSTEPVLQIVDGRHPVLDATAAAGHRSCPTTRSCGRDDGMLAADHRPEHGRQEHVHPPGGAAHADGPDRQLRAGPQGDDRRRRPHLRPRRRQRRAVAAARARSWSR